MSDRLARATRDALDALAIGARPLLVVDVDEVLLRFVPHLESFMEARGYRLTPVTFGITGNVFRHGSDRAVPAQEVAGLIAGFFATHVGDQMPVEGAPAALARLADRLDIVLLTNAPFEHREARAARLAALGMAHPLVMNDGPKGPAVARLARRLAAPLFFVDDGPQNLVSVRDAVEGVRLVHFVDDPRYFRLSPEVPGTWVKSRDWNEVARRIEAALDLSTSTPPR